MDTEASRLETSALRITLYSRRLAQQRCGRKPRKTSVKNRRSKATSDTDRLFQRADDQWGRGNLKSAFRLFLAAAKAGDPSCQTNLGNFYSEGIGVRANRAKALYWYRRAYGKRDGSAAHNIGILYRDDGELDRALTWFERALNLGNFDAHFEIAKIYLRKDELQIAIQHLEQVCEAKRWEIAEATRAFHCYLNAAKRGYKDTARNLAHLYETGHNAT